MLPVNDGRAEIISASQRRQLGDVVCDAALGGFIATILFLTQPSVHAI
jgi:hypothetical protein